MDPTTFRMMSGATAPPVQITFTADNNNPAANTNVTLTWSVLNATSVSIDQGIGTVAASSSTQQSGNNVTRYYTLTAVGQDGITYTSQITIAWQAAPVQITFTADNNNPAANTNVTLTWSVLNSASVSINQGIGSVASAGSTIVGGSGYSSTAITYTLTAVGINGQTTSSSVSITWAAVVATCAWPPPWDVYFC